MNSSSLLPIGVTVTAPVLKEETMLAADAVNVSPPGHTQDLKNRFANDADPVVTSTFSEAFSSTPLEPPHAAVMTIDASPRHNAFVSSRTTSTMMGRKVCVSCTAVSGAPADVTSLSAASDRKRSVRLDDVAGMQAASNLEIETTSRTMVNMLTINTWLCLYFLYIEK